MKYFTECEDQLNNTLVDELFKQGLDKNLTQLEAELNDSSSSSTSEVPNVKRVHFTPNFTEFMTILDSSYIDLPDSKDFSLDLKNELGACLERLKNDANNILALTANLQNRKNDIIELTENKSNLNENVNEDEGNEKKSGAVHISFEDKENELNKSFSFENKEIRTLNRSLSLEEKISSLTRQLLEENQAKNNLMFQLNEMKEYVTNLESERVSLENQMEEMLTKQKITEGELHKAREKITELIECGHKEIVSEGYGESVNVDKGILGIKKASLGELQERARILVAESGINSNHALVQLIDELCKEGDRILEEAYRDREDLLQQVKLKENTIYVFF